MEIHDQIVAHIPLAHFDINSSTLHLLTPEAAFEARAIPLIRHKDTLIVAMDSPGYLKALDILAKETGLTILPLPSSIEAIDLALVQYYDVDVHERRKQARKRRDNFDRFQEQVRELDLEPVENLCHMIISDAVRHDAERVEFVTTYDGRLKILYCIDGESHEAMRPPKTLTTRILKTIRTLTMTYGDGNDDPKQINAIELTAGDESLRPVEIWIDETALRDRENPLPSLNEEAKARTIAHFASKCYDNPTEKLIDVLLLEFIERETDVMTIERKDDSLKVYCLKDDQERLLMKIPPALFDFLIREMRTRSGELPPNTWLGRAFLWMFKQLGDPISEKTPKEHAGCFPFRYGDTKYEFKFYLRTEHDVTRVALMLPIGFDDIEVLSPVFEAEDIPGEE